MPIQSTIVVISWAAFLIFWIVSSIGVKKDTHGHSAWRVSGFEVAMRLVMVAVVVVIVAVGGTTVRSQINVHPGMVVSIIGTILVVLGVALAIWARVHLGRNWSSHPSLKEGHELITSGPYALVRHPIYTGVIVSALGSALVTSVWWLVIFLFLVILFVRRVYLEEAIMTAQFPDKYPEYKKRTWALVPWVW